MKSTIFRPSITLMISILFIISQLVPSLNLDFILNFLVILLLVSFNNSLNIKLKIISFLLLAFSLFAFLYTNNILLYYYSMDTNLNLLMLFIFVPLMSIPIKEGQYIKYAERVLNHYITTTNQLYLYLKISTLSFGSVMNLGSIPITYQLTNIRVFEDHEKTRVKAITRGFSLAFLWSPYFISMAYVISYFDVSWFQLFVLGFLMSVVSIIASFMIKHNSPTNYIIKDYNQNIPILIAKKKSFNW